MSGELTGSSNSFNFKNGLPSDNKDKGSVKPDALSFEETSGQGGPGWEAYVGAAASTASEMYYSKTFGTWMGKDFKMYKHCLLYTSPSPRDRTRSRMPSSA